MSEVTPIEKALKVDLRAMHTLHGGSVVSGAMMSTLQYIIDDLTAEMHATTAFHEKVMLSNIIARYLQLRIQIQERCRA